jgi:ribosomal protein S18 acetylase RimI-like enzyme
MNVRFATSLEGITPGMLSGFFVGWPHPPSPATHLEILSGSWRVVLALDDQHPRVAGFINAVSDGILSAYIPLLEVLPAYQRRGIGTELVRRMLGLCGDLYMVDTTCDPNVRPFYARCGMKPHTGMMLRNYARQSGRLRVSP